MEAQAAPDSEAELRGFNLPPRNRLWRERLLPRAIIPLFWLYWLLLLPAVLLGTVQRRRNRRRPRVLAIESGKIGWTQVFFEELIGSAREYAGASAVVQHVIDRDEPYLAQLRANLDRDRPTHVVLDVRTPGQSWGASLRQALGAGWSVSRRGIVPVVVMTDAFYRRQRWHASVLSAHRGVVVTWASAEIVSRIFPHRRLIGPLVMPISRSRLAWLEERTAARRASGHATGSVVRFIGHVYSPRKDFLDCVAERLAPAGISLVINGDKAGTSNDAYWQALVDSDVVVTTTLQGPDRSFMDWIWVQQAVFRFIETMAAGAALVASEVPGIERFFVPGREFLEFMPVDEAVSAIESLVRDAALRESVIEAGHAKAAALIRSDAFWTIIDSALGRDAFTA